MKIVYYGYRDWAINIFSKLEISEKYLITSKNYSILEHIEPNLVFFIGWSDIIPKEIIERLPVRLTYDNNYFNDKYQGIPIGGYTQIFEKLLEGIDVKLSTDFFTDELPKYKNVIYTGPIDKYFNYQYGHLEYKTVRFEHSKLDMKNYQGTAVMNYTEKKVPKTRTIEHKHFENSNSEFTWVSDEFPTEYKPEITDPYYPVNDETNNNIYEQYKKLSIKEKNVYFGGRLAEYKYYDMDKVILSALNFVEQF
jgi:UDP-galactopyranose mutase